MKESFGRTAEVTTDSCTDGIRLPHWNGNFELITPAAQDARCLRGRSVHTELIHSPRAVNLFVQQSTVECPVTRQAAVQCAQPCRGIPRLAAAREIGTDAHCDATSTTNNARRTSGAAHAASLRCMHCTMHARGGGAHGRSCRAPARGCAHARRTAACAGLAICEAATADAQMRLAYVRLLLAALKVGSGCDAVDTAFT